MEETRLQCAQAIDFSGWPFFNAWFPSALTRSCFPIAWLLQFVITGKMRIYWLRWTASYVFPGSPDSFAIQIFLRSCTFEPYWCVLVFGHFQCLVRSGWTLSWFSIVWLLQVKLTKVRRLLTSVNSAFVSPGSPNSSAFQKLLSVQHVRTALMCFGAWPFSMSGSFCVDPHLIFHCLITTVNENR